MFLSKLFDFLRIADTELGAQAVHPLHHANRFRMRHKGTLYAARVQGADAGFHFVFIAGDALWRPVGSDKDPFPVIDPQFLRAVDIDDLQHTVVTVDDAAPVAHPHHGGVEHSHPSVRIPQGDGILPLHEPRPWRTRSARPPEQELVGDNHAVYQIDGHIGYHDEQQVVEDKLYRLFTEQHPVDEPQIVDVEDDRDADGLDIELHEAEVAYAPHTLEPLDEEEREEKDDSPCQYMNKDGVPAESYMLSVGCHSYHTNIVKRHWIENQVHLIFC